MEVGYLTPACLRSLGEQRPCPVGYRAFLRYLRETGKCSIDFSQDGLEDFVRYVLRSPYYRKNSYSFLREFFDWIFYVYDGSFVCNYPWAMRAFGSESKELALQVGAPEWFHMPAEWHKLFDVEFGGSEGEHFCFYYSTNRFHSHLGVYGWSQGLAVACEVFQRWQVFVEKAKKRGFLVLEMKELWQ